MPQGERLNPGCLRQQITWQRRNVATQNAFGDDVLGTPAYLNVVTAKAELLPANGREFSAAQQRFAEARYMFRQHFYSGLTPDMRISWYAQGQVRTLDVLDIQESTDGRVQTVIAKDHVE